MGILPHQSGRLPFMSLLMPQSHPTTGPIRFLSPVRFLAHKAEWSAHRNFSPVLFSWWHQATVPVQFDTGVHLWFDRIIHGTPHGSCEMPVRASYRPRTGISDVFHVLRNPYGPVWDPQGCRTAPLWTHKRIDTTRICKNPARASYSAVRGRMGPLRSLHRLFTGCLRAPKLYGARKLIMHGLKLYGPLKGRQNSYGTTQVPYGSREWTYDFCLKQPRNSPATARTGPGSVI